MRTTQDMCNCIIQTSDDPIIKKAHFGARRPLLKAGKVSNTPTKNRIAPGRMYEILTICVEYSNTQGAVSSHDQMIERGTSGSLFVQYHAKKQSDANDKIFKSMKGASGTGRTKKGNPTNKPCNAPGICTSGAPV